MASKSIGSLYAELTLRDKNFTSKIQGARKSLMEMGKTAMRYGTIAVGGAATVGAALGAGTLRTLDQVDAMKDMADQTGLAIDQVAILGRAYKDGGRDAEMLGKDIGKMQKTLAEASTGGKDPFAALGLSVQELMAMSPSDQFQKIGDAIMRIQNPALRTAKAMEIFGKGGMGLTTVFPGMEGAVRAMGKMPQLAKEFGAAMGEANDLIGHLPLKSDQFFMGFTSGILGTLLPNLKKIDEFDFTQLGQNLGASLAAGTEMIHNGRMWTLFEMYAGKAITSVGMMIENQIKNQILGLPAALKTAIDVIAIQSQNTLNNLTGEGKYNQSVNLGELFSNNLSSMKGESRFKGDIEGYQKIIDDIKSKGFAGAMEASAIANIKAGGGGTSAINQGIEASIAESVKSGVKEAIAPAGTSRQSATFQSSFTDYQRRGLSSGIAPISENKVQKQIDLLQGIKDILKQATLDGAVLKF